MQCSLSSPAAGTADAETRVCPQKNHRCYKFSLKPVVDQNMPFYNSHAVGDSAVPNFSVSGSVNFIFSNPLPTQCDLIRDCEWGFCL